MTDDKLVWVVYFQVEENNSARVLFQLAVQNMLIGNFAVNRCHFNNPFNLVWSLGRKGRWGRGGGGGGGLGVEREWPRADFNSL